MDTATISERKRPVQVTIAVWLIVFNGAIFLTKAFFLADWTDAWSFLTVPLVLSFSLVWIYPILRRQNWARWVVSIGTFLCCWEAVGSVQKVGLNWETDKFLIVGALIDMSASWAKVFFLFTKPANDWFRKSTPLKTEETPPNPS